MKVIAKVEIFYADEEQVWPVKTRGEEIMRRAETQAEHVIPLEIAAGQGEDVSFSAQRGRGRSTPDRRRAPGIPLIAEFTIVGGSVEEVKARVIRHIEIV